MEQGRTNNPNGRPAGVPNKLTKELRELLKAVIEREIESLPALLDQLTPQERVDLFARLIKYVIPVPSPVDLKTGDGFDFGRMWD